MQSTEAHGDSTPSQSGIPPGFSVLQSEGRDYLVPTFLINATDLAIKSEDIKKVLDVQNAQGGVSSVHVCGASGAAGYTTVNRCRSYDRESVPVIRP